MTPLQKKHLEFMRGAEQEPVAYLSNKRQRINIELKPQAFVNIPTVTDWEMPLYMKPPQRTWVDLTDDEMPALAGDNGKVMDLDQTRKFYKVIERLLKDKNHDMG